MKLFNLTFLIAAAGIATGCTISPEQPTPDNQEVSSVKEGPKITGAEERKTTQVIADPSLPPLPIEATGTIEKLPASYPESWVLVDEAAFFNMFGGKVIVLDVAEQKPAQRIKGMMPKNLLGLLNQSKTRNEIYIMETFHARGGRGPREDVLTIYDKTTLAITHEIVWPVPKRLTALPERYAMSLSADEKLSLIHI